MSVRNKSSSAFSSVGVQLSENYVWCRLPAPALDFQIKQNSKLVTHLNCLLNVRVFKPDCDAALAAENPKSDFNIQTSQLFAV